MANKIERICTDEVKGKYPNWNFCKVFEVSMDKNLSFASDMRVLLKRKYTSLIK